MKPVAPLNWAHDYFCMFYMQGMKRAWRETQLRDFDFIQISSVLFNCVLLIALIDSCPRP